MTRVFAITAVMIATNCLALLPEQEETFRRLFRLNMAGGQSGVVRYQDQNIQWPKDDAQTLKDLVGNISQELPRTAQALTSLADGVSFKDYQGWFPKGVLTTLHHFVFQPSRNSQQRLEQADNWLQGYYEAHKEEMAHYYVPELLNALISDALRDARQKARAAGSEKERAMLMLSEAQAMEKEAKETVDLASRVSNVWRDRGVKIDMSDVQRFDTEMDMPQDGPIIDDD